MSRARPDFPAKLRQMVRAIEIERALTKDRSSRALSRARALWRQYRGHPRRLARLFRQGAAAAFAWRGGAAWSPCRNRRSCGGRIASRKPRARRATACSTASRRPVPCRRRNRARQDRAGAGARRRCRCSRRMPPIEAIAAIAGGARDPADAGRRTAEESRRIWRASARTRLRQRSVRIFRLPCSPSTMRRAKCWRRSVRRSISTTAAPDKST